MNELMHGTEGAYYAQHGRAIVLYDPLSTTTRPILRLEPNEHEVVLLQVMDRANAYDQLKAERDEAVELLRAGIDPNTGFGWTDNVRAFLAKVGEK